MARFWVACCMTLLLHFSIVVFDIMLACVGIIEVLFCFLTLVLYFYYYYSATGDERYNQYCKTVSWLFLPNYREEAVQARQKC
jgi:hypothetical protein